MRVGDLTRSLEHLRAGIGGPELKEQGISDSGIQVGSIWCVFKQLKTYSTYLTFWQQLI